MGTVGGHLVYFVLQPGSLLLQEVLLTLPLGTVLLDLRQPLPQTLPLRLRL